MLTNLFPPKSSLKNLIINTLIVNGEISTIGIKKYIKQRYCLSATYQGINKILNQLLEEQIVYKMKRGWNLNPQWTQEI